MNDITCKKIECEEIVVRTTDGKSAFNIVANKNGCGLWIREQGADDAVIAIYSLNGETCIGIYGKGEKNHGLNVALAVDQNGDPFISLVKKDGQSAVLTYEQLSVLGK